MEQVMSVFLGNQFHKILVLEAHVHLSKTQKQLYCLSLMCAGLPSGSTVSSVPTTFLLFVIIRLHFSSPNDITVSVTPGIQLDILEEMPNGCSVP